MSGEDPVVLNAVTVQKLKITGDVLNSVTETVRALNERLER